MPTEKRIRVPYNFEPREYQLPFLKAMDSGISRAVIVWHRRSGKDKVCFNYMVKRATEEVGTYFYFLPTYTQAKKVIWDNIDNDGFKMIDHIPLDIAKRNNSDLKFDLFNGSVIQLIAADRFEFTSVGTNPRGIVMSEYSITEPQVWNFIRPILKVNKGWAIFNFTPRGMNHAAQLLQIAKNNPERWYWEVLTIDDTKILTQKDIEEEQREGMPQDLIEQEYFCKFIEGAGAFFRRIKENTHLLGEIKPEVGHRYKIGVDLAKHEDYTVITVLDLMTFKVVAIDRFNQIDWNLQKARIEAITRKYNNAEVWVDSTGVGEPIYEDLATTGLNIAPFKFTEQSRKDLLNNLAIKFELDKIKIPNDQILIDELKSMRYDLVSERGKLRVQVPEGLHDDCIMSLALAVWEMPDLPIKQIGESLLYLTNNNSPKVEITSFK